MDTPPDQMSPWEIDVETLEHVRHLRRWLDEFTPLLSAIKGNGNGDAVRLAGLRRARKVTRDA